MSSAGPCLSTLTAEQLEDAEPIQAPCRPRVALVGNPNAGKTTLFNRLTGLRAKTANFPGTTIERRLGSLRSGELTVELEDLPGLYGLTAGTIEERVTRESLLAGVEGGTTGVLVVVDATQLTRSLYLVGQVRELGLPLLVVLNMMDVAESEGVTIDVAALSRELSAPVLAVSARTGAGFDALEAALGKLVRSGQVPLPVPAAIAACGACAGCGAHSKRFDWAEEVVTRVSSGSARMSTARTEQIDRVLTHPVKGLVAFGAIMSVVFIALFSLASYPMAFIESAFAALGTSVGRLLPNGDLRSLVVDGIIGGVGGVLVFLPQIAILFFFLSLLEDSGYLARAAFVMDRLMGKVGLPGKAFVPMLSAHACAIPAIMAARVIEGRRDRLVSILVLPLLTCSARLPVYSMVTALLFTGQPILGGLVFAGAYALGAVAALLTAWALKKSILPGASRPLLLELPTYKVPSLRNALLAVRERGLLFVARAGSVILLISLGMWAVATYPKASNQSLDSLATPDIRRELDLARSDAARARSAGDPQAEAEANARLDALAAPLALEHSVAGRIGKAMEPVFRPLGFDWRINVGILSSFAARETLVSTLAVVYGAGSDVGASTGLRETLRVQRRPDGSPVFTTATALSLLVFFVLAMQCLPTQAVTRRETGSWKWAALQFGYMTVLAYTAALVTHLAVHALGLG